MTHFPYHLDKHRAPQMGLVVLQADETIEQDFRRLLPSDAELLVTRVPSGDELLPETIGQMEHDLADAVSLFPNGAELAVTGFACTSGSAQIGTDKIDAILRGAKPTKATSDPVRALIAACKSRGIKRLGLLSPYVDSVSVKLRQVLSEAGISTPVFGSFQLSDEASVVRIDEPSIAEAAMTLADESRIDALFLSCTNLRTLNLIDPLEAALDMPVMSSNLVLAWHMCAEAGLMPALDAPGRLLRA